MLRLPALMLVAVLGAVAAPPALALEFTADQITRINGHSRKANVYYRDDRWRLEHHDLGPVNVTIVRKDKQVMWLLLSRMKHFKTVPYDPEQAPKVSEKMEGEVAREEIGTETLDGHPTTLYQVTVRSGGREEVYYQWLATDIRFPLKLAKLRAGGGGAGEPAGGGGVRRVRRSHLTPGCRGFSIRATTPDRLARQGWERQR